MRLPSAALVTALFLSLPTVARADGFETVSISGGLDHGSYVAHLASRRFAVTPGWGLSGAELGLYAPRISTYGVHIDLGYGAGYGVFRFDLGGSGADGAPTMPLEASGYATSRLQVFRIGAEGGGQTWLFDEHLRLRVGAVVGGVFYSVPTLPSSRTFADAVEGWVQPRLSADVFLGEGLGVSIGGYAATELFALRDVEVGVALSLTYKKKERV